jgi:hypothetical protein
MIVPSDATAPPIFRATIFRFAPAAVTAWDAKYDTREIFDIMNVQRAFVPGLYTNLESHEASTHKGRHQMLGNNADCLSFLP